jgi:hypothetical protein
VGLVEEVEENAAVAAVFACDAVPERRRVFGVGQGDQPGCLVATGGRPVQVEDHVEAGFLEGLHVGVDGGAVRDPAVAGVDAVDPQPAALVQRQPHRVDVPALHRLDRRRVGRALEDAVAFDALVLGSGAVDAEQAHGVSATVDEAVALHPDPGPRRPGRRRQHGDEERSDHDRIAERAHLHIVPARRR